MKLIRARFALAIVGFGISVIGNAQSQQFLVTVENLGPQGLSPLIGVTSNTNFDIFTEGQTSSLGIKNIAESGNTTALEAIIASGGSDVAAWGKTSGPIAPSTTRTFMITADPTRPFFSFATMLGRTNDGWLGISIGDEAINLFSGLAPVGGVYLAKGADAWDAGTELNTQNAVDLGFLGGSGNPADSNNLIRRHAGIISGVGDSWSQMPAWTQDQDLARISVTPVPEPATMAALGLGAAALLRRRRKQS
jgi:hypothetical protein